MTPNRVRATIAEASRMIAGDPWGAVSRAYYAVFFAAQLYLDERHEGAGSSIKTHRGMGLKFYELAVLQDGLPSELAKEFEAIKDERENVDYDDQPLPGNADLVVERAELFIKAVLAELEQ